MESSRLKPLSPTAQCDVAAELKRLHARRSEFATTAYLTELLGLGVAALPAVGAVVWSFEGGELSLEAGVKFRELDQFGSDELRLEHRRHVAAAVQQAEIRWLETAAVDGGATVATPYLILLLPLRPGEEIVRILEFFVRSDTEHFSRPYALQTASRLRTAAEEFLLEQELLERRRQLRLLKEREQFARTIHRSLEIAPTSYHAANEIRRIMEFDRVSVAVCRGGRCRIVAVSNDEECDPRSKLIRRLQSLASSAIRARVPFLFDETVRDVPPELEDAVHEYLETADVKQLMIVPLLSPSPEESPPAKPPRVIGAVVVERFDRGEPSGQWQPTLQALCEHTSSALTNAVRYEWPILAPVGRFIRRARAHDFVLHARRWALAVTAVLTTVGVLAFWPVDFKLSAPGRLQPVHRRDVFAEVDGTVQQIHVKHGDKVARGKLLIELVNHDLNAASATLVKQIKETEQEVVNAEREALDAGNLPLVERERITARRATMLERLRGLRREEATLAEKRERLKIVSPVDGQVVTWNVQELLQFRPVQRGQILVSVVESDREWELELRLPENRLGHILEARRHAAALPVTFVLSADPYRTYTGTVRQMHLMADVTDDEEGNTVLTSADVDEAEISTLQFGAEVKAKIRCGEQPLGYVLFHELYEFLQAKVFFTFSL